MYEKSINNLAMIYYEGKYIKRDIKKAIQYLLLIENQKNPAILNNLGFLYISAFDIPHNKEKAIHYFTLAADKNNITSQHTLGLFYYEGYNVPQDINKAIYYFTLAANQNDPFSQYYLGIIYYSGKYVPKDFEKALKYLTKSASRNFSDAQLYLGNIYLEGKYVKRDINKAIHFFKELSSFDISYAKNNLGVIYSNGFEGIKKNIVLAKEYFEEAIRQQSDFVSMYNLANVLLNESNSDNNTKKAIKLLIDSASKNFVPSFYLLDLVLNRKNDLMNLKSIKKEFEVLNIKYKKTQLYIYYQLQSTKNLFLNFISHEDAYQLYLKTYFFYTNDGIKTLEDIKNIQTNYQKKLPDINEFFYQGFYNG